jgi:hypothetical protein
VGVAAGEVVLADAAAAFARALSNRLIAVFALGSLAHGGSDADAIESVAAEVRDRGTELHKRLSVFWATLSTLERGTEGGRFPPLDRLDLIEHGRLLVGHDPRENMTRPSRADVFLVGAEFALDFLAGEVSVRAPASTRLGSMSPGDDSVTKQLRDPALLLAQGPRRLTKLVLFPVRFLFTAETGQVGTNALAVEHYLADPEAPAKQLIDAALGWRLSAPASTDEVVTLLGQGLIPLYRYFIDDHRQRLVKMGRGDLAERYERWQARLLA